MHASDSGTGGSRDRLLTVRLCIHIDITCNFKPGWLMLFIHIVYKSSVDANGIHLCCVDGGSRQNDESSLSSQTHLLGADRTCRNTVVLTPERYRILAHRPRVSKLTQKPHTSTVNRTRPTRFPHSNNHAPPDCVNTIFPENDFSSGSYVQALTSISSLRWSDFFFAQFPAQSHSFSLLAEFHPF